ncbi:ParM/StbA family protein [Lysinibacillus boronitolerans]|uniref:ParM/StbA family protein n=1 Tax=Lysinibacillus boronitolerans TaxID=309788 RepID=UPI0002F25522|nr:ParM/StbA family protein [Lysinibacillus boronitolerans]
MQKPKALIAVDSGKHATKAIMLYNNKEYYAIFRTKMQEVEKLDIELYPGSFYVNYNNKNYLIGDIVDEAYCDFNLTKQALIHKLCIYTAITQLLKQANLQADKVDVRLAVNIPISAFKDANAKKSYLNFIENHNNPIMVNVNGDSSYFTLENTIVVFEGVGNIFNDMKNNSHVSILDLGGLNVSFCIFDKMVPMMDSMVVSNHGISMLRGKIGRAINEKFGVAVTQSDLERILHSGYLMLEGKILAESHDMIERIKRSHFDEIINFAKSRNYTFNNTELCFCGGGSLLLRNIIEEKFPNAQIIVNPQFANVKSFLQILKVKNNL